MRRALDDVERSARIEAERSRLSFEIQQQAEVSLSLKFKNMISDLQKEWESEEAKRAQQLEEKLLAHAVGHAVEIAANRLAPPEPVMDALLLVHGRHQRLCRALFQH